MLTFPPEITSAFLTLLVSTLVYLFTTFIQQRTNKNKTLKLIGTVYDPLRYFLEVRYIGVVTNVLLLTNMFFLILSVLLDLILGSYSNYLIDIIIIIFFILGMILYYVYFKFFAKRNQKINDLIDEISSYITVDIDSLTRKWNALYWGTLVLAERYFLFIFIVLFSTTLILSILSNDFVILGLVLILFYIISFIISLVLVDFSRRIVLGSNNKRLKVSFFDTIDEIESRLFNLIKEPSLCLCIVDDKGNKYCGSLEGITYSVLIRDISGILVGIPYDHVYRVEECKG